jgi:alpha-ketoglutarate-dependent taurine dioxygenase
LVKHCGPRDYQEDPTVTTVAPSVELAITPLTGTTGAEIRGVSLREPLPPATVAEILQALYEYKVIFFPGQHLSTDEHFAFTAQLGEITEGHPTSAADKGRWGLNEINYTEIREQYAGRVDPLRKPRRGGWHTDVTFMETPPAASILNAIAMPERGGDTVFANTQAAYEGLSAPFRAFLDGLVAVHDGEEAFGAQIRANGFGEWDGETFTEVHAVEHPLVRTHPETGKRALFVNPEFTSHIKGFSRHESDGLLELLYQHMVDQKYTVRYNWNAGDLGIWDNRATMHLVVIDYGTQHRLIQRATIKGERPF